MTYILLTRLNAAIARLGLYLAVFGLVLIVGVVAWQVFGRYALNDSPTWTENFALVLILYVTLIGAAVGVRDAGHLGMESLLVLMPSLMRKRIEIFIHLLVAVFGLAMFYNGIVLAMSVAGYKIANLEMSEAVRYVPLALSGAMTVLFSLENVVAQWCGVEVQRSWH